MCHRFLPVPLSSGAVMRICGPGPILRASIHISGSGRVQSARVYMHTRIHIYMHTPAHRGAAGLPQGFRWRPNAAAGPFCGPWHTPRAAAGSVSGYRKVRAGPRRCGRGRSRPHPPSLVLSPAALGGDAPGWTSVAAPGPRQPLAWLLSGGHLAPHLPRRTALRRPRVRPCASGAGVPQRRCASLAGPSQTPCGTPAAPERPGAAATKAANRWQIPAWFGRDAGAAPIPARARLRPIPKENVK